MGALEAQAPALLPTTSKVTPKYELTFLLVMRQTSLYIYIYIFFAYA